MVCITPKIIVQQLSNNAHTRRPCRACQRPCLDNFLAWRQRDISALYTSSKERVLCLDLGNRLIMLSVPFSMLLINQHTTEGACVHEGMRCASVSNSNRSSAAAINVASLTILDVLRKAFFAAAGFAGAGADDVAAPEAVAVVGAGVPARLGSPLTVKSLPCLSVIATGNSANLTSRATGRRFLARS